MGGTLLIFTVVSKQQPFVWLCIMNQPNKNKDIKCILRTVLFSKTKIIFGLIKIASSEVETISEIQKRIKDALEHIDRERFIAAPDCGLGHLPRKLAMKKLKTMVEALDEQGL